MFRKFTAAAVRKLRVALARRSADGEKPQSHTMRRESAASWLLSLAFHMLLIILLGLLYRAGGVPNMGAEISLTWEDAGGGNGIEPLGTGDAPSLETVATIDVNPLDAPVLESSESFVEQVPVTDVGTLVAAPQTRSVPVAANVGAGLKGNGKPDGLGVGIGTGKGPGRGRTSVFGVRGEGEKFLYVLDCSGSMNAVLLGAESSGEYVRVPFMAARAELLTSLNDLNERQAFGVIFFNHQQFPLRLPESGTTTSRSGRSALGRLVDGLYYATAANKQMAAQAIAGIRPEGETDHVSALEMAIRMKPDVIFYLTDGEAKDDPAPNQVKRLTHLNHGRAAINVIQFAQAPRPDSTMIELAKENRGEHTLINVALAGPLPGT